VRKKNNEKEFRPKDFYQFKPGDKVSLLGAGNSVPTNRYYEVIEERVITLRLTVPPDKHVKTVTVQLTDGSMYEAVMEGIIDFEVGMVKQSIAEMAVELTQNRKFRKPMEE
jgi:hypothetical protein